MLLAAIPAHHCHWPIGEATGAEQRFCGRPCAVPDAPYCADHMMRAHKPATAARRREQRLAVIKSAVFNFNLRRLPAMADGATIPIPAPNTSEAVTRSPEPACPLPVMTTSEDTLRPVSPLCAKELTTSPPATDKPMVEWMAPEDLLVDSAYQRDLSDKSIKLIHKIVQEWDWRRFKPPVVAWTERGFEIIDGQHTAIAAATHPLIERIPVLVVEAVEMADRAAAFIGHNRDRLAVSPMQMHHAAVAAGDEDALTINQVCERAGVNLVAGAYGKYRWKAGDTVAIGAIGSLISRRGAQKARMILQALVAAGCAPVAAHEIKAAEMLFTDADYVDQLEPLPEGASDLAAAIRQLDGAAEKEAKVFAAAQCVPFWRALGIIWFRKCRKRRKA